MVRLVTLVASCRSGHASTTAHTLTIESGGLSHPLSKITCRNPSLETHTAAVGCWSKTPSARAISAKLQRRLIGHIRLDAFLKLQIVPHGQHEQATCHGSRAPERGRP
jgi:hypothetical protein